MEYVFVFILSVFQGQMQGQMIEIGGFKTERECQAERVEIIKDMEGRYKTSRCFKVWKYKGVEHDRSK
jgi:hypothetical protein